MKDVEEVLTKLAKANTLMENLIDLAMDDAKISQEEKDMLFSINENLASYAEAIIETVSDGRVDLSEKEHLRDLEKKIVTDAHARAKADNNVSDEERILLNKLVATIQSI